MRLHGGGKFQLNLNKGLSFPENQEAHLMGGRKGQKIYKNRDTMVWEKMDSVLSP
jgi:hypothetical protein